MQVLTEDETLDAALKGISIARYGDGELRLAVGGTSISQRERSPKLTSELRETLSSPPVNCLACIPRLGPDLNDKQWLKYSTWQYKQLYNLNATYGSLHITRPDSAPHINRPDYWAKLRSLWANRNVVLVRGCDRSLVPDQMRDASSIREVMGLYVDSYKVIDRVEAEIGTPPLSYPVIICMGATATVLAARLARKGVWALDLGHVGMFMRRFGV